MPWAKPEYPTNEELQTFEYVLEYGGEMENAAIIRTNLKGMTRYWQLRQERKFDDEYGEYVGPIKSSLEFLSTSIQGALAGCPHPFWKLVGLNVATDIFPAVDKVLQAHGTRIEDWLHSEMGENPHVFTCKYMWPNCDVPRRPVDTFWLTARPETMRRTFGGLSAGQISGLKDEPGTDVGVLVDRKGRVILTAHPDYLYNNQWTIIPFERIKPFTITCLSDLWVETQDVERL